MTTTISPKKKPKVSTKHKNEIGLNIGCVTSWKGLKECEYLLEGLEACLDLGYNVCMLAKGDSTTLDLMLGFQEKYPKQFTILEDNDKNREWVLRHSHVLLIPHEPVKLEIQVAQNNKLVPLTVHNKYLDNFNPSKETGQAFLFESGDQYDFMRSVIRAAENKQFGYDWGNLKKALGKVEL